MPVSKRSPVKKSPAKKSPAKKSPVKKSPAKKSPAKTAKKSPVKKSPAKLSPAKRAQLAKVLLGLVAAGGLGAVAYKNRDQIKETGSNNYRNYFGPTFGPAEDTELSDKVKKLLSTSGEEYSPSLYKRSGMRDWVSSLTAPEPLGTGLGNLKL